MNKKLVLIIFLLGVTLFSLFKFLMSVKEKRELQASLTQAGAQITAIEKEKQNLAQIIDKETANNARLGETNARFKLNLRACNGKIFKLNAALEKERKLNEELSLKTGLLQAENETLKKSEQETREKYDQANLENQSYKAKFSSVAELKKAIRELKLQARKAVVTIKRTFEREQVIDGNRGYIIKDGRPTSTTAKVKIQVIPVTQN